MDNTQKQPPRFNPATRSAIAVVVGLLAVVLVGIFAEDTTTGAQVLVGLLAAALAALLTTPRSK